MTNGKGSGDYHVFEKVLLVEDDPGHSVIIRRSLRGICRQVQQASTVSEAISLLETSPPDLLITDLSLPDTDGISHLVSFNEISPDVPVVVLTASTRTEDAVEAMKRGAKDFLLKEFNSSFPEALHLSLTRVFATVELERERKKLQVAVENSEDGLALVRPDGEIRYSNTAFRTFAGMCGADSESLFSLFSDKVRESERLRETVRERLLEARAGSVWTAELSLTEESERAFDMSLSGLSDGQSSDDRESVVWLRDRSEQKRREKFQREILSTTTHDLKGPMGAIITGSELLLDSLPKKERPHEITLRINSAAHGVVNLIDEFLSARRIEAGNFILKPAPHPIEVLIDEPQSSFSTIAQARSIDLTFTVEEGLIVNVDKLGFTRVLGNLLSNAVKFTPQHGKVSVEIKRADSDGVVVRVSDTGSGMEPAEVSRVFERFSRLSKHNEVKGTGLGLFVVKSIASAHGASIEVFSKKDEGTTFEITFPGHPPVDERGELICLDFTG
ncbi:MAG: response regulator [Bdellovibrionales bacterium]|nr:response regulator [Bdellovibrionales bacterium]